MAGSTVLTSTLLGIAGITGDLLTLLTGKTVTEAKVQIEAIMAASIAGAVAYHGDVTSRSTDGHSVNYDMAQLEKSRALLNRLSQASGGGPVSLPVRFQTPDA